MAVGPEEAVKNSPVTKQHLVKDFWPRLRRGAVLLIILLQSLILLGLALVLNYFNFFSNNPAGAIIAMVAQSLVGIVASLIVYRFVARPIKSMLAALVHVAGEPTTQTPPNPNEKNFERSGIKPVLQTIYQLASDAKDPIEEGELAIDKTAQTSASTETNGKSLVEAGLNQTVCGVVILNNQRQITYANKAAPIAISTEGEKSLSLIFNDTDTIDKWLDDCDNNSVHAEKTWARVPNKLPDSEDRRFYDVLASYEKGTEAEVVLTLIDRTYLYHIGEQELDFIAFAAHELRGPVTVIRGYVDVLAGELSTVLQDDQKELFRRLEVSSTRLAGYINNILNTSRYDRRHLHVHLIETSLKAVYDTIRDDMDLRAQSQNRLLSVNIPSELPTIGADTASLGEVLSNLIDNAIKYSNEGGAINVSAISKGDTVEIAVEDHGIGMPGSVVSNLFQKFYRSHRSRETVAGTGIGLYISKAIVESHGGTISVRSEDGRGSTFTVSLPTYATIADKLKAGNNNNEQLIDTSGSWIKNHNMYRG